MEHLYPLRTCIVQVTGLTPGPVIVVSNMLKQTVRWTPPNITDMTVITGYLPWYRREDDDRPSPAKRVDKGTNFAVITLDKPTGRITYHITVTVILTTGQGTPSEQLNITYKRKYTCSP